MMSLPVWLPGPMFLPWVSIPGPMFLPGGEGSLSRGSLSRGGFCPGGLCLGVSVQGGLCRRSL